MLAGKRLALAIGANIVGNALEWYEFYLYILFTPLFAQLFFPADNRQASLLQALFVIAVGFFSRPFGAVLFGQLGDRRGRRVALLVSILLMTVPTFVIGFIPTYAQIGLAAPILIASMRLLQGIPAGGEFTGAMCYLYEISPPKRQGIMGSMVFFGSQVGAILSMSEFLLMEKFFTHHQIGEWGWRLSFILGGIIGLGGWYLRFKLQETPIFKELIKERKISSQPVLDSLKGYKVPLFKAFLLTSLTVSGWYLIFIFSPIYSSEVRQTGLGTELLITILLILLSNLCLPLFGWLADKSYKRSLVIASCIATIVLAYPLYFCVVHDLFAPLLGLKILMAIILSVQFALIPQILCELFPAPVRYSSVGISYNICNIVVGGSSPFIALFLTRITGSFYIPMYMLMLTALLSLIAILSIKPPRYN